MKFDRIVTHGSVHVGHWPSIEEFAADAKRGVENRDPKAGTSSTDNNREYRWTLGESFEQVHSKAMLGWPEVSKRIRDTAMPIVSKVFSQVEVDHFDHVEDGSIASGFDVAAVSQGDPFYWLQHKTDIVEGKGTRVVRIASSLSAHCGVNAEQMVKRGVVAAALAYCLEAAGLMVDVVGVAAVDGHGGNREIFWVGVKTAGQVMDLNRVAMVLAHPGTLRRLRFGVSEGDERTAAEFGNHGYGMPSEPKASEIAAEKVDILIGNEVLNMGDGEVVSFILKKLEEQGLKIRK